MSQTLYISQQDRVFAIERVVACLNALPEGNWQVDVKKHRRTRSNQQNRFLWSTYQTILDLGGEELAGWRREDLHEFFLIEHFGSETLEGFGRKRLRPLRRSSKLSTVEFMDFVGHIQQFMAERGVYLPDPNEEMINAQ